jgi:hypothetical protein
MPALRPAPAAGFDPETPLAPVPCTFHQPAVRQALSDLEHLLVRPDFGGRPISLLLVAPGAIDLR